jgi:c(7)-type cytochrome triheme protein
MKMSKPSRYAIRILPGLAGLALAALSVPQSHAEYGDVIMNKFSAQRGVAPVRFSHQSHRVRFRCVVCHEQLGFEMKTGANQIDMAKIAEGNYCGACHNGQVAWAPLECERCHSVTKPGGK